MTNLRNVRYENGVTLVDVIIRCPECGTIQRATVEGTVPFPTYIHECEKCDYIIMESEWLEVEHL